MQDDGVCFGEDGGWKGHKERRYYNGEVGRKDKKMKKGKKKNGG
jgi:hypothetical protein